MVNTIYLVLLSFVILWKNNYAEDPHQRHGAFIENSNHPYWKENVLENIADTTLVVELSTENPVKIQCDYSTTSIFFSYLGYKPKSSLFKTSSECCHHVNNYAYCPEGYIISNITMNDTLCYKLQPKSPFPPVCDDYPNPMAFYQVQELYKEMSKNHAIWINVSRDHRSMNPEFIYMDNGERYGSSFYDLKEDTGYVMSNCVVISNGQYFLESCNKNFFTLCVYSYARLQSLKLKAQCKSSDYEDCIVSDFYKSQPICFCKKVGINKSCKKLAEPINVYQSLFLKKYLKANPENICQMGMYKHVDQSTNVETYKWQSTKKSTSYTYWAEPSNCEESDGGFIIVDSLYGGWVLKEKGNFTCVLCEVSVKLNTPTLSLRYSKSNNQIVLTVTNVDSISDLDSYRDDIYCFSDSGEENFVNRVNLTSLKTYGRKTEIRLCDSVQSSSIDSRGGSPCPIAKVLSSYWCHAFDFLGNVIKSNTITARDILVSYTDEFMIILKYTMNETDYPFKQPMHFGLCKKIKKKIVAEIEGCPVEGIVELKPVSVKYNNFPNQVTIYCRLITNCKNNPEYQYNEILEILKNLTIPEAKLKDFKRLKVCAKTFSNTSEYQLLEWPTTAVGASAVPVNILCLDRNRGMLPVTRRCFGDAFGFGTWGAHEGDCYKDTEYPETTNKLFELAHGDASTEVITQSLLKITGQTLSDQPIDVHLASTALERISVTENEKVNEDNFTVIINNMMKFDNETLETAQSLLNSTDRILALLDSFIVNSINRPWIKVLPQLVIQVSDLRMSNVNGLCMYSSLNRQNFQTYKIVPLYQNTSFEKLLNKSKLDLAIQFPTDEIIQLREKYSKDSPIKLVIVVFYDDILFRETRNTTDLVQSKSKVIGVTVPGYKGLLRNPIKIAFRTTEKYENKKNCSYWNYGLNDELVSVHGQWEGNTESKPKALEVCEFHHMTHFGLLIQGDLVRSPHDLALNIITAIGSGLSLIGIIPMFLTACMFKSWRNKPGNIILINFCVAITIQIFLMFLLYAIQKDGLACKTVAACLHYIVLSEFSWMFVVALLQHRRFVTVFTPHENNVVAKCLAIGWGFPLLPVIVTLSTSIESYKINPHQFCYISGYYLIFAYICPILVILLCNVIVFTKIIFSISQTTLTCAQRQRNYKLQIMLALFLFFVLGITWIFGLLGALSNTLWLTYIFCITATLRGIVLFLFFIVGNEETMQMWKKKSSYFMDKPRKSAITSETVISSE